MLQVITSLSITRWWFQTLVFRVHQLLYLRDMIPFFARSTSEPPPPPQRKNCSSTGVKTMFFSKALMLLFLICGWLSELRNPLPGRERWGNGGGKEGRWLGGWLLWFWLWLVFWKPKKKYIHIYIYDYMSIYWMTSIWIFSRWCFSLCLIPPQKTKEFEASANLQTSRWQKKHVVFVLIRRSPEMAQDLRVISGGWRKQP